MTKNIIEKIHPTFKGTTFGSKRYLKKNPQKNFKLNPYENILKPTTDYVTKVREFLNQQKELGLENTLLKNNEPSKNNLEGILELLEKMIGQSESHHKKNIDIMNKRDYEREMREKKKEEEERKKRREEEGESESDEGEGVYGQGVKIYKDPRPIIKKNHDYHKKLLKHLNDLLKPDYDEYKKAKGIYAKGMSKGCGVYGAGFFSSLGNIFKNVIGKVVSFGKNIFRNPGQLQKAVNTGLEVYKTGKDIVQNIKDKEGINAISNIGKLASNASNIRDIIKDNRTLYKPSSEELENASRIPMDKMARPNFEGTGRRNGGNALSKIIHIRTKNKGYGSSHQYV